MQADNSAGERYSRVREMGGSAFRERHIFHNYHRDFFFPSERLGDWLDSREIDPNLLGYQRIFIGYQRLP